MQKASTHAHKKQRNEYVEESAEAVEPINGQSPNIYKYCILFIIHIKKKTHT